VTTWLLPASTTAIAAVFASAVFLRWRASPKRHTLLWTVGIYAFAAAAGSQAVGEGLGTWPEGLFRTYYLLAGANVALLGAGTVYLLRQRRPADFFLYGVLGLIVVQAFVCALTPLKSNDLSAAHVESGAKIASDQMRALVVVMNIAGAGALIAGAVISYFTTRRPHNLLILAGALVLSAAGSIAGIFPSGDASIAALYAGNLIGISLLFLGFLTGRPASAASTMTAVSAAAILPRV